MKAVILAGGRGTRISEETHIRPKPMIEVGGRPLLWHIMKIYGAHGITEFVVCCGYRGYVIKEYFANYGLHTSDVTIDLVTNDTTVHQRNGEPWRVTLVDTGEDTQTGGRLRRVRDYLDGTFCLTYGDGVGDVDITSLVAFHRSQGVLATVTGVQPAGRYGSLAIAGDRVTAFQEKPLGDGQWVSAGFFVCEPAMLELIEGDATIWEQEPLRQAATAGELAVWQHRGFWSAMDTLRDRDQLEALWASGAPPWRMWS
ncbi:MAG: glucose-1-phosphate cytidylyltransferase [Actinomycetales bacterium]|nr:glucose-1-phosphate cytidylyltransferase [Actinomycetales bacterium]